jgi:WG containing repeat
MRSIQSVFLTLAVCFAISAKSQIFIVKEPISCLYGLKSADGKWIAQPKYTLIQELNYRRNQYRILLNNGTGIIDHTGKEIIPPIYDEVRVVNAKTNYFESDQYTFDKKEAEILYYSFQVRLGYKLGILDSIGNVILPIEYKSITDFVDGISIAYDFNNKATFVGARGPITFIPEKYHVMQLEDCLWRRRYIVWTYGQDAMKRNIRQYGICDENMRIIIPCEYDGFEKKGGIISCIAAVKNGKLAFLGYDGEKYTDAEYEANQIVYIANAAIKVMKAGKAGVLGKKAVLLLHCQYDSIQVNTGAKGEFIFIASKNEQWGIYGIHDSLITSSHFDRLLIKRNYHSFENFYIARSKGKWGAYDPLGKELIACVYDTFFDYSSFTAFWSPEDMIALTQENNLGMVLRRNYEPRTEEVYYHLYYDANYGYDIVNYYSDSMALARIETNQAEYFSHKAKGLHYEYYTTLGRSKGYRAYHIPQKVYGDSTWFVPHFNYPLGEDWRGESESAPTEIIAIQKKTNGFIQPYSYYPLDYRRTNSWFAIYNPKTQTTILASSDFKTIVDTLSCRSLYVYGYAKDNTPILHAEYVVQTEENQYYYKSLIDVHGKKLLASYYTNFIRVSDDTVWAQDSRITDYCLGNWALIELSTGKNVLANGILIKSPFEFDEHKIVLARDKNGEGLFDREKMDFVSATRYRLIVPLSSKGDYYSVLTFSGKTGIMNANGKFVTDTMFRKVCDTKSGMDPNHYTMYEEYSLVMISINGDYLFEDKKLQPLNLTGKKKLIDKITTKYERAAYLYDDEKRIWMYTKQPLNDWQYELLFDSVYHSPLMPDYRTLFDYPNRFLAFYNSCEDRDTVITYLQHWNQDETQEVCYASLGALSYQRSDRSINSRSRIYSRGYYNYLLYQDTAVCIILDSLFTGYDWHDLIGKTLMDTLAAHPEYNAPCMNANAYPFLLRNRFLLTEKGLCLYPEWNMKGYSIYDFYEIEILIPWEKLKPYLKEEVKGKLGVK